MANGEVFDATALTCAHRTLPLGTKVLVVSSFGRAVVEVTDRGPFCPKEGRRLRRPIRLEDLDLESNDCPFVIDLSPAAAKKVIPSFGWTEAGVPFGEVEVWVWVVGKKAGRFGRYYYYRPPSDRRRPAFWWKRLE